jgi:phosphate/sulfate permease
MSDCCIRKIVGTDSIVIEKVKKEVRSKNITKQTVVRTATAAIVLDCGHMLPVTLFSKVPANSTRCLVCARISTGRELYGWMRQSISRHIWQKYGNSDII